MKATTRCVYRIQIGVFFYIGSTTKYRFRVNNWKYRLKSGKHLTSKFMNVYSELKDHEPIFTIVVDGENLTDAQLRQEELKILLAKIDNPNCLNTATIR